MARDRFDDEPDEFDDRPARRDRDDRPPRPAGTTATTIPGVMLILVGALAGVLALLTLVGNLNPEAQKDGVRQERKKYEAMPPGPERDQQLKTFDWLEENIGTLTLALGGGGVLSAGLLALGGLSLVRQRGYGLAMFGSILAVLPCTNCAVCLAMPFGLWAIITLMNADVKAAFRGAPAARDY